MKRKEIEHLLERYMDGLTTLDEEARLSRYFLTHDVPEEWEGYKAMFAYIDSNFPRKTRRVRLGPPLWGTAAAAAAVLVILLLLLLLPREKEIPKLQAQAEVTDTVIIKEYEELQLTPEAAPSKTFRRHEHNPDTTSTRKLIIPATPEDRLLRTIPFLRLNVAPRHYLAEIATPTHDDDIIDEHLNTLQQIEAEIDNMLIQADYSAAIDNALDAEY